jgi:uncharacterized protein YjiS (DUF1127 family)
MRRPIDPDGWARHAAAANGLGGGVLDAFGARATNYPAHEAARTERARLLGDALGAALGALREFVRDVRTRYRRRREAHEVYDALRQLDDRTLHDLGFDRSELTSIAHEAVGQTEYSRAHALLSSYGLPR